MFKKWILLAAVCCSFNVHAEKQIAANHGPTPIFVITPLVSAPATTSAGTVITAIYQVLNISGFTMKNAAAVNLSAGITLVNTGNPSYCNTNPFKLDAGKSCLLKVSINTSLFNKVVNWNPRICSDSSKQFYCTQAFPSDAVAMTLTPAQSTTDCSINNANINYELAQDWVNNTLVTGWGYEAAAITMNPVLTACATGPNGVSWMQNRAVAIAEFWVKQKINYCHHYSYDYLTPPSQRCDAKADGASGATAGCCVLLPNLVTDSPTYGQVIKWDYTGKDSETATYWQQYNRLWYGVDCTNFTRLVYNMGFGMLSTGATPAQAGQDPGHPANAIAPNQQTPTNKLDYSCAPGALVCGDGTMDAGGNTFCAGHGGGFATSGIGNYFSLIDSNGTSQSSNPAVINMAKASLNLLQPGDIVYIAGALDTGQPSDKVTHAVIWTGKVVGYGPNDVKPSSIAPDGLCTAANNCDWRGLSNIGEWVIIDSHYQGADYRVFTNYFYLANIWGVRRVAGSSWTPGHNCNPPD